MEMCIEARHRFRSGFTTCGQCREHFKQIGTKFLEASQVCGPAREVCILPEEASLLSPIQQVSPSFQVILRFVVSNAVNRVAEIQCKISADELERFYFGNH